MSVAARLYVSEISRFAYNPAQVRVTLQAVSRGGANAEWEAATPAGTFTMTISNQPASEFFIQLFEEHKEIAVRFDEAPAE
jgi:hypothetical protein